MTVTTTRVINDLKHKIIAEHKVQIRNSETKRQQNKTLRIRQNAIRKTEMLQEKSITAHLPFSLGPMNTMDKDIYWNP